MTDILLLLLFCQDVGLWLEEIKLGSYRQIFKENGVIWKGCPCSLLNKFSGYKKVPHEMGRLHYVVQGAEADKRRSDVTGSRCGNNLAEMLVPVIYIDSIHVFSGLLEGRAKSPATMVGPVLYLCSVYEAEQVV
ncbi:hypothetical protein MTR67_013874 [Solanum verrucosum]|uniref:Uncharacterized protein n=1 Tax=Solanum verrucosum TaxID=315347 RepID=A0AAF0QB75_SOLVR|nr:hypothetical protein MTR67_013874 [Solanum verrucosum]